VDATAPDDRVDQQPRDKAKGESNETNLEILALSVDDLWAKRDVAGAVGHFHHAHRLEPAYRAANNLAWLLATCPDDAIRNGPEAVTLSEPLCRKNQFSDASSLDTLAAAYTEVGRFDEAVRTVSAAITIAQKMAAKSLVAELRRRLRKYEEKQPHREIP